MRSNSLSGSMAARRPIVDGRRGGDGAGDDLACEQALDAGVDQAGAELRQEEDAETSAMRPARFRMTMRRVRLEKRRSEHAS
jgi:hypothetical protein